LDLTQAGLKCFFDHLFLHILQLQFQPGLGGGPHCQDRILGKISNNKAIWPLQAMEPCTFPACCCYWGSAPDPGIFKALEILRIIILLLIISTFSNVVKLTSDWTGSLISYSLRLVFNTLGQIASLTSRSDIVFPSRPSSLTEFHWPL